MRRQGKVISVDDRYGVAVRIGGIAGCRACERGQGCGLGLFPGSADELIVHCTTTGAHQPGDPVQVQFDDSEGAGWLLPVIAAYGLPLAGLLVMSGMPVLLSSHLTHFRELSDALIDLYTGLGAAIGLAGGIFAWRRLASPLFLRAGMGQCTGSVRIVDDARDTPVIDRRSIRSRS